MNITIEEQQFSVVDTKEKITIADSFVVRQNKLGSGNGEAKLYIGQNNSETRNFFGTLGFVLPCFLLKSDLQKYLEDTKIEYTNPEQPYLNKDKLPELWQQRKLKVDSLPEKIDFEIAEQSQIEGPRVYVKSNSTAYKLIRGLSLPNITFISVVKLLDNNGRFAYYLRLFADYFGEEQHPYTGLHEEEKITKSNITPTEQTKLLKARTGQGEYRTKLLLECPFCPITMVTEDRLLIASHIKPWSVSNEFEKTDPKNGLMLTPTFDRLFDRGFLSFSEDKKTIISPFLSKITYSRLGISDNKMISNLPIEGREEYLAFHRNNILKK